MKNPHSLEKNNLNKRVKKNVRKRWRRGKGG